MMKFLGPFLIVVGLIFMPTKIFAQSDSEGISITPVKFQFRVNQGQSTSSKIKIKNIGSNQAKVELYVTPFGVTGEDYSQVFERLPGWKSAAEWIKFSENTVDLKPQETKEVSFTADVDEHAAAGGHYAAVFAQTQPEDGQNDIVRVKRVGAFVYFDVGGSIARGGLVENFSQSFWIRDNKINETARLKNTGNVHIDSKVRVTIKNILGKQVKDFSAGGVLFPGTIRRFKLAENVNIKPGLYIIQKNATIGEQQYKMPAQLFIAATPAQLLATIFIAVSSLVLVIVVVRKFRVKTYKTNRSRE